MKHYCFIYSHKTEPAVLFIAYANLKTFKPIEYSDLIISIKVTPVLDLIFSHIVHKICYMIACVCVETERNVKSVTVVAGSRRLVDLNLLFPFW